MLEVNNVTVAYDNKSVVKKCTFRLEEGEIAVLLGASGEGKTSLLKAIAGLKDRKKGSVYFQNEPVKDPKDVLVPGHDLIRLVNQDFNLDEFNTVEENIRMKLLRFDKDYLDKRTRKLLRLGRLTTLKNKKARDLSGGQKQRLAIARALADEPELLLLDEPFNQLDFRSKNKIAEHIRKYLKDNNITAILVTHNGMEAMEWADKIIYMEKGKIKRIDSPDNFFEHPNTVKEAGFFGELNKLKINGEEIYFRPSFFSSEQTASFKRKLKVHFEERKKLGWYSIFTFSFEGQLFKLFSTEDISSLTQIYIRSISLND